MTAAVAGLSDLVLHPRHVHRTFVAKAKDEGLGTFGNSSKDLEIVVRRTQWGDTRFPQFQITVDGQDICTDWTLDDVRFLIDSLTQGLQP